MGRQRSFAVRLASNVRGPNSSCDWARVFRLRTLRRIVQSDTTVVDVKRDRVTDSTCGVAQRRKNLIHKRFRLITKLCSTFGFCWTDVNEIASLKQPPCWISYPMKHDANKFHVKWSCIPFFRGKNANFYLFCAEKKIRNVCLHVLAHENSAESHGLAKCFFLFFVSSSRDDCWLSGGGMFKRKINFTFSVCNCLHFYSTILSARRIGYADGLYANNAMESWMQPIEALPPQWLLANCCWLGALRDRKKRFEKETKNTRVEVIRKANAEWPSTVHAQPERINRACFWLRLRRTVLLEPSTLLAYLWAFRAIHLRCFAINARALATYHSPFFNSTTVLDVHWTWFPKKMNFHVFFFLHLLLQHVRGRETAGEMLPVLCNHNVCVNNYTGITVFGLMLAGNIWRPFELCHQNE